MKVKLLIALLILFSVPALVCAQNTYAGGIRGTVTGNCVPKSTGPGVIATTVICSDGTTTSINTNKVTITESNGNTAIAGTLDVTGLLTLSGGIANTGALTVISPSASALAVGRLGATTPAFTVDSSTGSQVAGLKVTGAATGGTVAVVVTDSGADANLTINAKGTGTIGIGSVSTGAVTITPATTITAATTVTSASASSLAVGRLGATTPAFVVDSSTGTQAAGLKVTGAAAAGTVAISTTDAGADSSLTVNAKGAGTIGIGNVSTGIVTITPATTVTGALTPTGGVVAAGGFSASPRLVHSGGIPARVSTDGSDYTVVATEVLIAEIFVPANMTVTGVALLNGSAVAGNVKVGLANSAGAVVATSASTAQSGTDAYQRIAFTSTYAAKGPATYYILAIGDTGGGTSLINTHTFGNFGAAKQTGQVYSTGFTTITPPTTFTTALAPIAGLY